MIFFVGAVIFGRISHTNWGRFRDCDYTKLETRTHNNLRFIGDTVSLNKPTTGGGIIYSFYDILGRELIGELEAGRVLRKLLEHTPDAAMDIMFKLDLGWLAGLDFDFHHR